MVLSEQSLPPDILARATLRGNEYAWRVEDIPIVIEAARTLDLINVGGQLQFRLPDGGTCECYSVEVNTYKEVDEDAPWAEKVSQTANAALKQFEKLLKQYDFLEVGKSSFTEHLAQLEKSGGSVEETLCFVWYVEGNKDPKSKTLEPG